MCPRFESRWYHNQGRALRGLFFDLCVKNFNVQPDSTTWIQALQDANADRVVWIHETALNPELVNAHRRAIQTATQLDVVEWPLNGGEHLKSWGCLDEMLSRFGQWSLTRSSVIISTGGGAMSDAVGFAASIWKRGMRVIHMPTTPLAAVDAAWGGKTAFNWDGNKNQVGTFHEPLAVHIDARWMGTLDEREFRSGLAEMAKHALLDPHEFKRLTDQTPLGMPQSDTEAEAWTQLFFSSAQIKLDICTQDPTEKGVRTLLNLGHTVGHAIEAATANTNTPWLHGEAVALGIHFCLHESECLVLDKSPLDDGSVADREAMSSWLRKHVPLPKAPIPESTVLWQHMVHDKKNVGHCVRDVAWRGVGQVTWPVEWNSSEFEATWTTFVRSWNETS